MNKKTIIPLGITLGTKICIVPAMPHSMISIEYETKMLRTQYIWVDRHEVFGELEVVKPFSCRHPITYPFTKREKIQFRSPVSGLLLSLSPNTLFILLPDDEPKPITVEEIYFSLFDYIDIYREYLRRARIYDQEFFKDVAEYRKKECIVTDVLPEYGPFLDEARTKHYQLRPVLKHLVAY